MSVVLSVSHINRYVASKIKGDNRLKSIYVKGEVSNFTQNYNSKHMYFSLKDENSLIRCVMFSSNVQALKCRVENGMSVIVFGSVDVYERDGAYQIIAVDIIPAGEGIQSKHLNDLKDKLSQKGYFKTENKKTIPELPKRIGVVASLTSAALQDIINIISRRFPIVKLCVFNAAVQGALADRSVADALKKADAYGVDTIIIARGGGSSEDLNCFNSEIVADAVFNLKTPCISAVGHETDVTICDMTADYRAPTPSAAAEVAVPKLTALISILKSFKSKLYDLCVKSLSDKGKEISHLEEKCLLLSPVKRLAAYGNRVDILKQRLKPLVEAELFKCNRRFSSACTALEALSPLKVLSRGYSLVEKDGNVITDGEKLLSGDVIDITFSKGKQKAQII